MNDYDDPHWYEHEHPEHRDIKPMLPNEGLQPYYSQPLSLPAEYNREQFAQEKIGGQQRVPHQRHNRRQIVGLAMLLCITFLGGWFGHQVYSNTFDLGNQSQANLKLFEQAWADVDQNYVDRNAVNYKQMSYQAIRAMLATLHDKGHTRFLTPAEAQADQQELSGEFIGIGVTLHQEDKTKNLIITSTVPGAPAEKAGLRRGDMLIAVNHTNIVGKDIKSVSRLIQGKEGTSVSITAQRPATRQTHTYNITRAQIQAPSVLLHYIAEDHIAHIQMVEFSDHVSDQLKDALTKAKKMGATKIILDLRDNPGGFLAEATNTASEFLKSGNVLIEQDSKGNQTADSVNGNTVNTTSPLVVLVDGNTASAAEIVSGALKDNNRAKIIGTQTYGTGTVLTDQTLDDSSVVRLGTREWLTPHKSFIRDKGITPDVKVSLNAMISPLFPSDENAGNMTELQILRSGDTQLVRAIQQLEQH